MDNFTEGRNKRAKDIISRLRTINGVLANAYKGVTPDGINKYGPTAFPPEADVKGTIYDAMTLIEELTELWEKEAEDKKTESRALDILERLQTECPARYRSLSSIEVTPSSEKLTFWIPDSDDSKVPEPELFANKKTSPDIVDGFITLNRIIDNFDSYENVRLERGCGILDGVYLKYDNKIGCSFAFQFGDFIKELQGKEENNEQKTSC